MIHFDNQTDTNIDINFLENITSSLTDKDIELIFISEEDMKEINTQQRGKNTTTDVLSFPLDNLPHTPLGSILINTQLAKQKAAEFSHTQEDEITLLYIHGLLHLLGFDHEIDNGQMREEEEKLIKEYNLPKSLIIRTQEEHN